MAQQLRASTLQGRVRDVVMTPSPTTADDEDALMVHATSQDREGLDEEGLARLGEEIDELLGDVGKPTGNLMNGGTATVKDTAATPPTGGARAPTTVATATTSMPESAHQKLEVMREAVAKRLLQQMLSSNIFIPGGKEIAMKLLSGDGQNHQGAQSHQVSALASDQGDVVATTEAPVENNPARAEGAPEPFEVEGIPSATVKAEHDLYFTKVEDASFPHFARIGSADVVREVGHGLILTSCKNVRLTKGIPEWVTTGVTFYFPANLSLEVTTAVGINPNLKGEFAVYTAPKRGGVEVGVRLTYCGKDNHFTVKRGRDPIAMVMVAARPAFTIHHRAKMYFPDGVESIGWPIRRFEDRFDDSIEHYPGRPLGKMGRVEREEAEDKIRQDSKADRVRAALDALAHNAEQREAAAAAEQKREEQAPSRAPPPPTQSTPTSGANTWAQEMDTARPLTTANQVDLRQLLEEHRRETEALRRSLELRDNLLRAQVGPQPSWPVMPLNPPQPPVNYFQNPAGGEPVDAKRLRGYDTVPLTTSSTAPSTTYPAPTEVARIAPYQLGDECWDEPHRADFPGGQFHGGQFHAQRGPGGYRGRGDRNSRPPRGGMRS